MRQPKDIMINGVNLELILEEHKKWTYGTGGKRANLSYTDLSHTNLSYTDLSHTNLNGVDLSYTNLSGVDLSGVDLSDANLSGANLSGAKNLDTCLYNESTSFFALQCPEEGSFIAWKKCKNDKIVKLEIPSEAKRSSATSRKCRAEFAKVLEVQNMDGSVDGSGIAYSKNDGTTYEVGEIYYPDSFDENRWNECSNGVHFFITRQEAVNH